MEQRTDVELLAEAHIRAAIRRLADSPFDLGIMPVYADLYRDHLPLASVAVVPDQDAMAHLCALCRGLEADAVVFTADSYVASSPSPTGATLPSRFEVGDPAVFEALSIAVGSLEDGFLLVHVPYAHSIMDGLEFHAPVVTGLGDADVLPDQVCQTLIDALRDPETLDELTLVDLLDAESSAERVAVLVHGAHDWPAGEPSGWGDTPFGLCNMAQADAVVAMLAAAQQPTA